MQELILHLRCMQLFSHNAHNLMSRVPFFQDHEFFGEVYAALEGDYDSVVERTIGLMGEQATGLNTLPERIALKMKSLPSIGVKENSTFLQALLSLEAELCKLVALEISKGVSSGTEQLIGEICNQSEIRQYKIKQRLKK